MKIEGMDKKSLKILLAGALLMASAAQIQAQPRGGFDGPPPPRDGGPREGRPRDEKRDLGRFWHDIGSLQTGKNALSKVQSAKIVALVLPWTKKPKMSQSDAKKLHSQLQAVLTSAQSARFPQGPPPPRGGNFDGPPPPRGGNFDDPPPPRRGNFDGPPPPRRGNFDGPPPPRDGNFDGPPTPRRGDGRGEDGRGGPPPRMRNLTDAQRTVVRAWHETAQPFYAPTGYASWKNLPSEFAQDQTRRYKENRAILEALSRKSRA